MESNNFQPELMLSKQHPNSTLPDASGITIELSWDF
jgi:hypothetical protein